MFSYDDASGYIHALKQFNKRDHCKYLQDFKIVKMSHYEQAVEAVSSIKSLSKTDAQNLLKKYGVSILIIHA